MLLLAGAAVRSKLEKWGQQIELGSWLGLLECPVILSWAIRFISIRPSFLGTRLADDELAVGGEPEPSPVNFPTMRKSHAPFQGDVKRWLNDSEKLQLEIFLDGIDWVREGLVAVPPTWPCVM